MDVCLIKETKSPIDKRAPLSPFQYAMLQRKYPGHNFFVESSSIRCFADEEYAAQGIEIVTDPSKGDILIGVKEVDIKRIIRGKTYLFFSHTAKEQSYNQKLLQALAKNGVTLIDYEYLVNEQQRVVAFGYWAGIVGAYNGLRGLGIRANSFTLKPANNCADLDELKSELKKVIFDSPYSIVITGEGRVASGACEILESTEIKKVSPEEFLIPEAKINRFCQIGPQNYTKHKQGKSFSFYHFVRHPKDYESSFLKYAHKADMLISAHFWDPDSPVLFLHEHIQNQEFRIRIIADITCDIEGSVPTTIRPATIDEPFYGVNLQSFSEEKPFTENQITVMAVDNLPGELPRDASISFGEQLSEQVIPDILNSNNSELIRNATILEKGNLGSHFLYLKDFLQGN